MKKLLLLLCPLLALACASSQILSEQEYWKGANEAMDEEAYDIAIDQLQKLMEEYPFSEYSEEAQLKIAYAQYLSERYPEAIASFQDFQRMHPTSSNLPFAEYYLAMSYMDQMGTKDRDQSASGQAHAHFQSLVDRYPDSPFAERAREKLRECREALAEHELTVAQFYLYWGNPLGAEARLRYMLTTYPDTEKASEALYRFGEYFQSRGDLVRASLAFGAVTERYPNSAVAADAKEALADLAGKNVEPGPGPLASLIETLGRPSATVQPVPAEDRPSALPSQTTQVDTTDAIR